VVKRKKIVEEEPREKPFSVVANDMWKKNKFACVSLAIVIVSWLAVEWFSRNRSIKSWAYSQGLSYDSSYDYKMAKRLAYFDPLNRGSKSYAFNVMKGSCEYQNKTTKAKTTMRVRAFDFSYVEVQKYAQSKRVHRVEKLHEMSTLVFDVKGYKFQTILVSPRELITDRAAGSNLAAAAQNVDEDTSALLKRKEEDAAKAKAKAQAEQGEAKNVTTDSMNASAVVAETKELLATNDTTVTNDTSEEVVPLTPEAHPVSTKFNSTFRVLAEDHVQADSLLSPALKEMLLAHPKFNIEFQEGHVLIYREYTVEPSEYADGLKLGTAILAELPHMLAVDEAPSPKSKDTPADATVFVSRSEAEEK